jgi:hypothetical protein
MNPSFFLYHPTPPLTPFVLFITLGIAFFFAFVCGFGFYLLHFANIMKPSKVELERRKLALKKLPPMSRYDCDKQKTSSWINHCVICLEDFKHGEACQVFPFCNHIFHSHCIRHWLIFKWTCPICRTCVRCNRCKICTCGNL